MKLRTQKARPLTATEKWLDGWDLFAAQVKTFNFEGRQKVHSTMGCMVTLLVRGLLFCYASLMFQRLMVGSSPNIFFERKPNMYSSESEGLDLNNVTYRN